MPYDFQNGLMDAKGAERPAFSAFWATKPMGQMQKKKKIRKLLTTIQACSQASALLQRHSKERVVSNNLSLPKSQFYTPLFTQVIYIYNTFINSMVLSH